VYVGGRSEEIALTGNTTMGLVLVYCRLPLKPGQVGFHLADNPQADTPAELCRRKLKVLADRLDQFHAFAKGQFVRWKTGLKNRKFPDYGEPAIVTVVS
jgi:hypothetical protein